jgi:hypothetical protein
MRPRCHDPLHRITNPDERVQVKLGAQRPGAPDDHHGIFDVWKELLDRAGDSRPAIRIFMLELLLG